MSYLSRVKNRISSRKRTSGKISKRRKKGRAKYKTAKAKKSANKRKYDRRYLLLMAYIRLRDQFQCALCLERNIKLEIHHIRKYSTHARIRKNRLNLISVCKKCHNEILKNRENQFRSMLSRKAKYNTKRYRLNPLTYEELLKIHSDEKLLPKDFEPFKYKTADEVKIKKAKEFFLRKTWRGIKHRCHNKNNKSYDRYGGRGISFFQAWRDDYEAFYDWIIENLGDRPEGHSLDRINNDGNYEPGNLRWASSELQARNRSTTLLDDHIVLVTFILYHKYKKTQTQIMNIMGANNPTIIRNVCKFKTFKELTINYKSIVKEKKVLSDMNSYIC